MRINFKENLINSFILWFLFLIFIFSQLFTHRYGIIDVTLIFLLGYAILFGYPKYNFVFPQGYISLLSIMFVILIYIIVLQLMHNQFDLYLIGRVVRVTITLILMPLVILSFNPSVRTLLKIISFCILIHSVSIFLQITYEADLIPLFASYVNLSDLNYVFNTRTILIDGEWTTRLGSENLVHQMKDGSYGRLAEDRGFGIARSYDKAALFLCFNIIINYYLYVSGNNKKFIYLLLFFISYLSGIYTGRTFMIVGTLLSTFLIARIVLTNKNFIHTFIICVAVVLSFIYIVLAFYPILEATIRYGFSDIIDPKISINEAGIDGRGFALGSFRTIMGFFKLPDSIFELLLGGTLIRVGPDSGFIKLIFSTGLIGLMLHLFFYIKLTLVFLAYDNKNEFKSLILPLLLIMFIFDFKDMNILSKNVTELFLLLLIVLIFNKNKQNLANLKKI
tara:strand:- start:1337 stop:2683 length:1347 start_codon:yes stop_codon:yes gene_type:complete